MKIRPIWELFGNTLKGQSMQQAVNNRIRINAESYSSLMKRISPCVVDNSMCINSNCKKEKKRKEIFSFYLFIYLFKK